MTYAWMTLGGGRHVYRRVEPSQRGERSELPSPMLIRDQMEPTWHPIDGREYESKAEFRRITQQNGGVELGNDALNVSPHIDDCSANDVGQAIRKVNEGYRPTLQTGAEGWTNPTT